ncbi:MAG: hypothetical protein E7466_02035 [Ruminococcaceae bacterium]|nr:hypothetical protein [Oscillospiraceae bacterium]
MAQLNFKRYRMDLDGKSLNVGLAALGLSFFLRALYYFGCVRIENVGFMELLLWMILPMLLEGALIVLLRVLRLDAPGLYAILAAAFGLVLMLQLIGYGSVLRLVLGILTYLSCGVLILGVAGGFLSKQIAVAAYLVTALVRFFCFEMVQFVFQLRVIAFVKEITGLLVVIGLMYLAAGFKRMQSK